MKLYQPQTGNWSVLTKILRWSLLALPSSFVISKVVVPFLSLIGKVILPAASVVLHFIIASFRETSSDIVLKKIQITHKAVPENSYFIFFLTWVIMHFFDGSAVVRVPEMHEKENAKIELL